MTIRAHAKINLDLRLGKRRLDGFHPIDTFFIRVDVADILEIRSAASGKLTLQVEGDPQLSSHPDNLVLRAARALQLRASRGSGADILLKKRIPQGAGLGGGSSDAASTLVFLRKLWDVPIEDSELAKIGAELGSDIPFFLQPYAARGTGRGEILKPIHLIHLPWAVLIHPGFASPTASAYAAYAKNPVPGTEGHALFLTTKDGSQLKILPRNDLENAVESKFLWIESARRWMGAQTNVLASRMSGSGSTVFGLFPTQEDAEKIARDGRGYFGSSAWIQVARLLGGPE
jgi:4-diphosphocytidyl-2-C-methyl-D-erythritol kinase